MVAGLQRAVGRAHRVHLRLEVRHESLVGVDLLLHSKARSLGTRASLLTVHAALPVRFVTEVNVWGMQHERHQFHWTSQGSADFLCCVGA